MIFQDLTLNFLFDFGGGYAEAKQTKRKFKVQQTDLNIIRMRNCHM